MSNYSSIPPAERNGIQACSLYWAGGNRLRLSGFPPNLVQTVREAITSTSKDPIQSEKGFQGCHEFKLSGKPFIGTSNEVVMGHRLIAQILTSLAPLGWTLVRPTRLLKNPTELDEDTLFFLFLPQEDPDPEIQIFSIAFVKSNRLRVVDSPSPKILECVESAVQECWKEGVEKRKEEQGSSEIKLKGDPWWTTGTPALNSRLLLSKILSNLATVGYRLYGSINVSNGGSLRCRDLGSWFFRKTSTPSMKSLGVNILEHELESESPVVCCLALSQNSFIQLLGVPENLVPILRETIQGTLDTSIEESQENGFYQFKIPGNPWAGQEDENNEAAVNSSIIARRLLTSILTTMASNGWRLIGSFETNKKVKDQDTLFFQWDRSANPVDSDENAIVQIVPISFHGKGVLRIIDAPDLLPHIKNGIETHWLSGISNVEKSNSGYVELELDQSPWRTIAANGTVRIMLAQVIVNLRATGFEIYGGVTVGRGNYGGSGKSEETWFLRRVGPNCPPPEPVACISTQTLVTSQLDIDNKLLPVESNGVRICCLSMTQGDRLRLIAFPSELVPLIREAILEVWTYPDPIQKECDLYGCHEFKIRGNPWIGTSSEAVMGRKLLTRVFTMMAALGWHLFQSSDVSKCASDEDTLFFQEGLPDPDTQVFCLSLDKSNRIRVIEAHSPKIMEGVKSALEDFWKKGIQEEREYYGVPELKLEGEPWWASGEKAINARMLLAQILANMVSLGFQLYASINMSSSRRELETWFFRKVGPTWITQSDSKVNVLQSTQVPATLRMPYYAAFPPAEKEGIQICCIALNGGSGIGLLGVPSSLGPLLRDCIQRSWGNMGIESDKYGTHQFLLQGSPWFGRGEEAVKARQLVAGLLDTMTQNGWTLVQSADVSRKLWEPDTLFFQNGPMTEPEVQIIPVAFHQGNILRLIGSPCLLPLVKSAAELQWKDGIDCISEFHGSVEVQFGGAPWFSGIQSRMLLAQMLANFKSAGFQLYASINMGYADYGKNKDAMETWFLRKVNPD